MITKRIRIKIPLSFQHNNRFFIQDLSNITTESRVSCNKFCKVSFQFRNSPEHTLSILTQRLNANYIVHQQNTVNYHRPSFLHYYNVRHHSNATNVVDTAASSSLQYTDIYKVICESAPVEFVQNSVMWLHSTTNLPWWATIMLSTLFVRTTVTLPVAVYQQYIFAKVENLKGEMDAIVKQLQKETDLAVRMFKWDKPYAKGMYQRSLKKQWQQLIVRDNCHPMKGGILILIQMPLWICLSVSLRNLCFKLPRNDEAAQAVYDELATGGFSWITNLTQIDHFFIIPISLGLLNLSIIEVQNAMRLQEPLAMQRYIMNFFRVISIVMIPLAALVPSGLSLYWVTSSMTGLIQNLVMMSPGFRRFSGIPKTQFERSKPYSHLWQTLKCKISIKEKPQSLSKV